MIARLTRDRTRGAAPGAVADRTRAGVHPRRFAGAHRGDGWEALHGHDLRLPWLGRPFVGLGELRGGGAGSAIHRRTPPYRHVCRGHRSAGAGARACARAPHAHRRPRPALSSGSPPCCRGPFPTVVAALVWRFMFDAQAGIVTATAPARSALSENHSTGSFIRSPRGCRSARRTSGKRRRSSRSCCWRACRRIDPALDEAARMDGAGAWRRFVTITLPLLRPALVVAAAFRMLDALRLFDLAYVLTGGGPGTATEPLSLYAFIALMQRLRFGYGSALSVTVFLLTFAFALIWVRALGRSLLGETDMTTATAQRGWCRGAGAPGAAAVPDLLDDRLVPDAGIAIVPGAAARAGRPLARPLPCALRRARLPDPDPQLPDRGGDDDRRGAAHCRPLCLRARATAVPRPRAAPRADPGRVDVPADFDRAAAVSDAARAAAAGHLSRPRPPVRHVLSAAGGMAAHGVLPATVAGPGRSGHARWRVAAACAVGRRAAAGSARAWRRPRS